MIRKCLVCGADFKCSPSDKTVTCSAECKGIRRSQLLKGKKQSDETRLKKSTAARNRDNYDNLKGGTAAAMESPKAGRFVTNSSAKRWILQSPDGTIYRCTNLSEFIRKNGKLFGINGSNDKEVERIRTGFTILKRGQKNQTRMTCNGGWSLRLHPDDDKKNCER